MWSVWQTCRTGRRAAGFLGGLLVALLLAAAPAAWGFGSPENLSNTAPPSRRPAVAANGSGQVSVAWREGGALDGTIMFRRSKPLQGSCGSAATLEFESPPLPLSALTEGSGAASNAALAVTDSGVFAVWQALGGVNASSDVHFSRSINAGASFDLPFNLSQTPQSSTFPSVTADGSGRVFVAWSDGGEILVARSENLGQSFPVVANLSGSPSVDSRAPSLGTDGSSVFLAWNEGGTIVLRKFSAAATDMVASAAQTPTQYLSSGLTVAAAASPFLAVADDGMVAVTWVSLTGPAVYLWTSSGSGRVDVSGPVTGPSDARVARRNGSTLVTWQEMNITNGTTNIHFRVLGEFPEGPAAVSETAGSSFTPSAGVDPTGRLLVAWTDFSPGNEEIYFSHARGSNGGGSLRAKASADPAHVNARALAKGASRQPNLTVFIEPAEGETWSASAIIPGSVKMNGKPALGPTALAGNRRMVKFDRSDLLEDGSYTITGEIVGQSCPFSYSDKVDIRP